MAAEDFGSLGNVIAYLNGTSPLQERLEKSLQIFFIPLPVPVQHKEEVVISWLTDILSTNKALQYSDEELILVWSTLSKLLTSRRLQALCKTNWVCSFSCSFIETLVTTASNVTTDAAIKANVFDICDSLLNTPTLSPHISKLTDKSISLLCSLLTWIITETPSPSSVALLLKVFVSAQEILEQKFSQVQKFTTIYNKLLHPLMLVALKFLETNDDSQVTNLLLQEIKTFVQKIVFSKEKFTLYKTILELPLEKDSKNELTKEGVSFYQFLAKCMENNSVNTGTQILREFLIVFFQSYKLENCNYQLIINTVHLLGISLKGGPSIEINSIAALDISQSLLDDDSKETYLASILEAILVCKLDVSVKFSNVTFKKWLEKLGKHILEQNRHSKNQLNCLKLILLISPASIMAIETLIPSVISIKKFSEPSYLAFDNLLCEMLNIHSKMRNIDALFKRINASFNSATEDEKFPALPMPKFIYEGQQLLSPRFMKLLLSMVSSLGTQMSLNLGKAINTELASCHTLLQKDGYTCRKSLMTAILTVWLSARILSSLNIMEAMSISGIDEEVGRWMNNLAKNGILPLISDYLSLKERDLPLGCVLVDIVFVWAEIHANLTSTDTRYKNITEYPIKDMLESQEVLDFSSQVSFISEDYWKQLISTLKEDDSAQFVILQLVIQKFALFQVQLVNRKIRAIKGKLLNHDELLTKYFDYIFASASTTTFVDSLNSLCLIAYHLHTFLPLLPKKHLLIVARLFMSGVHEGREPWIKFGNSFEFRECAALHSLIFSLICDKIHVFLTGGKRKLKEDGKDINSCEKIKAKFLSHKILKNLTDLYGDKGQDNWVEEIEECYSWLETLLKREKKYVRLSTRSESELLTFLKIIGYFPLQTLQPKRHKSIFALLLVVFLEEGGLNGRQAIVSDILNKFNILACSTSFNHVFKLFKKRSFCLLTWLTKESEAYLGSSTMEGAQLRRILSKDVIVCSQLSSVCNFGEHINFLRTATKSFYDWNWKGHRVLVYSKTLVSLCKEKENKEAYLQATLMLILLLKKTLMSPKFSMNIYLQESVKIIGEWAYTFSNSDNLSKVTQVTISIYLNSFSLLLLLNKKLNIPFSKRSHNTKEETDGKKIDCDGEEPTEPVETIQKLKARKGTQVLTLDIDWIKLKKIAIEMACLCSDSENIILQQQSLELLLNMVTCMPDFTDNLQWSILLKTWKEVSSKKDAEDELETIIGEVLKNMSIRHYKGILDSISDDLQADCLNFSILTRCLLIISSTPVNDYCVQLQNKFMEKFIGAIALNSTTLQVQKDEENICKILLIFQSMFSSKCTLPVHWKSMVLGVCLNLNIKDASNPIFTKVFNEICKVMHMLLVAEPILICQRTSTVLSIIVNLSLSLIAQSDQKAELSLLKIKELECCGNLLEKMAKELRRYALDFSKMVPFTIASIVEGLQQIIIYPPIKVSMERVIFSLFDISGPHELRHLLVCLPPSITALLKHLHKTFEESYRYNPKVS